MRHVIQSAGLYQELLFVIKTLGVRPLSYSVQSIRPVTYSRGFWVSVKVAVPRPLPFFPLFCLKIDSYWPAPVLDTFLDNFATSPDKLLADDQ